MSDFAERFKAFAAADRSIVASIYKCGSETAVLIHKKPTMRNCFNPEFTGKLDEADGGVKMSGTLGIPVVTKVFFGFAALWFWAGFVIFLIADLFFPGHTTAHSDFIDLSSGNVALKYAAVFGGALIFFHALFILLGTVFQRGNKKYIVDFIEKMN